MSKHTHVLSEVDSNFADDLQRLLKDSDEELKSVVLRGLPLGFTIGQLQGGGTWENPSKNTVHAKPRRGYRGRRLFVCPSAIGVVALARFVVGEEEQLVSTNAVPAEMFSAMSFGCDMNLSTAAPNMEIAIDYISACDTDVSVTAGLMGVAIYSRAELEQEDRVMAELAKQIAKENTEGTGKTDVERLAEVKAEDEKWLEEKKRLEEKNVERLAEVKAEDEKWLEEKKRLEEKKWRGEPTDK